MLHEFVGQTPGLRGTPSSRGRSNDISILQSASRPAGASAAVQGDCPTINAGAWWCENYVALGKIACPHKTGRTSAALRWRMATYLLDTTVIIDAINNKKGRRQLLSCLIEQGNTLACCPINITEV
jgi:hypothetical protein